MARKLAIGSRKPSSPAPKTPASSVVPVSVRPRAGADRVGPFADGVLKVSVKAAPERGAANEAVTAALAKALGVPRSGISILRGFTGRKKEIRVEGVDAALLARFLSSLSEEG